MTATGRSIMGWAVGFFAVLIIVLGAVGTALGWFSSFTNKSVFVNKIS